MFYILELTKMMAKPILMKFVKKLVADFVDIHDLLPVAKTWVLFTTMLILLTQSAFKSHSL